MDAAAFAPVGRCPRCRGGLVEISSTELGELRCAACQGAWLDAPAVEQLANELGMRARTFIARTQAALPPLIGAMMCLRCRREMTRMALRSVEVDACKRCGGMWLDHGVLHRVSPMRYVEPAPGEVRQRVMTAVSPQTFTELARLQQQLDPPPAAMRLIAMQLVDTVRQVAKQLPTRDDARREIEAVLQRLFPPRS